MSDRPHDIEGPDEAALAELRRAFEEPGEQYFDAVEVETTGAPAIDADMAFATGDVRAAPRTAPSPPRRRRFSRFRRGRGSAGPTVEPDGAGDPDDTGMVRIIDVSSPADATAGSAGATTAPPSPPPAPSAAPAVISIEDHDIPDAVYLDGRLNPADEALGERSAASDEVGGGADRARYVIEDDERADPVEAGPAGGLRSGSIDPRVRDRRVAVRRAMGLRRLRVALVGLAVAVILIGVLAVLGSPLFSIRAEQVTVVGAVYTDRDRLQQVIDDLVGEPTLVVDTAVAEQALRAIPWVDDATVRPRFPSAVTIDIRERAALATYQGPDGRFRVIDRAGRVLDVLDGEPVAYMRLVVADAADLEPGQFTTLGPATAAELVRALTPGVRQRVQYVEVDTAGTQLALILRPWDSAPDGAPVRVRFGVADDILVKLVRLEAVLGTAAERAAAEIDVSTAEVSIR